MAKQLNVNMQFTADSKQAKREIEALQMSLKKLVVMSNIKPAQGMAEEIREATNATAELSAHLQKATNIKTGNLDFSKLSQSLKASGKSLDHYGEQLRRLGPDGQQAFMQLTQAVVQSEVPLRRTNALVKEFATTLANTARWQLSSSVLHGFMGALQSAYGYAQDLNESLNNIRIVTGASIDEMADFAKEANKAAKTLSTTTTQYTKASLIYFQQGLSEADVKKRADVTIKLANVSRQSAEDVSNQMTAIWNNFYDGSKSLEHYADVLTALGAATASSTEEIAGGLEKFAAIADTIGLSYDYAAAALATLTSNTRESEEVVGTALKTIFARIQGLKLGETLDDGTTINKYSEALAKVGINIKDTSGNLKDMDVLLDEMGGKWTQLSRDQQTALAQTVAGTRQYNQLMALMANWNNGDSDSFQANLATAKNADGTLKEQADIYAESWEAAADRVTAAAEAIYEKLINDEFFIDLLNNIEKIIQFVDSLIDKMGGLRGVIFTLSTLLTKVFQNQLAQGLTNVAYNIQMMTKSGRQKIQDERSDYIKKAADTMAKAAETGEAGKAEGVAAELYENQLNRQAELMDNADKMSEIEKETVQALMDQLKLRNELAIKSAEELEKTKERQSEAASLLYQRGAEKAHDKQTGYSSELIADEMSKMKAGLNGKEELKKLFEQNKDASTEDIVKIFNNINTKENGKGWRLVTGGDISQLKTALEAAGDSTSKLEVAEGLLGKINNRIQKHAVDITGASKEEIQNYVKSVEDATRAQKQFDEHKEASSQTNENLKKTISEVNGAQKTWADMLVTGVTAATAAASAVSLLSGMIDTLNNPDVSGWEKFTTVLTTLSMLIPTLITLWSSLKTIINAETLEKIKNAIATWGQVAAEVALKHAKGESTKKEDVEEVKEDTKKKAKSFTETIWDKTDDAAKNKYTDDAVEALIKKKGFTQEGSNLVGSNGAKIPKSFFKEQNAAEIGRMAKNSAAKSTVKAAGKNMLSKAGSAIAKAGPMIAAVAVAAAAIGTAVIAFNQLDKAFKKNELAAQRAEEAATNLAKAYEDAAAEYDKLNNTISNYESAQDAIKNLTRGTADFAEATRKANSEALSLIENYSEIIGNRYTVGADGLIQFDEGVLEEVKQSQQKELEIAQVASTMANQKAREARLKADATELNRNKIKSTEGFTDDDLNTTGKGAAIGLGAGAGVAGAAALMGATIGSTIPVVGTLIGAGIGLAAGAIIGGVSAAVTKNSETDAETEALQRLEEEYRIKGEAAFDENNIKDLFGAESSLAAELIENKDAVKELVKEMAANTAATEAENRAMAAQILADNKIVQGSRYAEEVGVFAGDAYGQAQSAAYDEAYAKISSRGWFNTGNTESKEAFAEYAKLAGLDQLEGFKATNYKGDGSIEYQYIDENGKKQKKTVTAEEMASKLAADDAIKATEEAGEKITKILNGLTQSSVDILSGAKKKDLSALSISELGGLTGELQNLSEEDLHALGFTGTKDEILNSIKTQQQTSINDLRDYANQYGSAVSGVMNKIISDNGELLDTTFQNVSQGALKGYFDTLHKMTMAGGEDAKASFDTGMQGILDSYSHKANEIMAVSNSIDWSMGDEALQEFNYQLLQMGVNVDENSAEWANLKGAMASLEMSVLNNHFEKLRATLADISKIAKDVKIGDILSDDDYNTLVKYNAELEKYFIMTADGYQFIGGIDLAEEAGKIAKEQLKNTKVKNERAKQAASAFDTTITVNGNSISWDNLAAGFNTDAEMAAIAAHLTTNSNWIPHIEALGTDAGALNAMATILNDPNATSEQKNNARNELKNIYSKIIELQTREQSGEFDNQKAEEVYASTYANTIDELNAIRGEISKEVYDKRLKVLQEQIADRKEEKALKSYEERIQTINDKLSLLSKRKDNAFGADKVAAIQAEINAINELIAAEQSYNTYLQARYNMEQAELQSKGVQFNANGNITNYNALINKYGADDPFWDDLDNYLDLMSKYNASKSSLLDAEIQKSSALLEKSTYQMQFNLEVDSRDIDYLNDKLERLKDDIYGIAEAYSYLIGEVSSNGSLDTSNSQLAIYTNQFSDFANAFNNLNVAYNNGAGAMSEKDYQEGLKQTYEGITNTINSLFELDEAAMQYYGDTLKLANEELDKHISKIEKQNKALEHYKNMLGILGKETDYKSIGIILEGQASVAKNEYLAANKSYEMYTKEAEKWQDKIKALYNADGTLMEGKEKELEVYEKNLEEAENLANEYYDRSVSAAEAWAEKEKAIIENTFAQLNQSLENALTGGTSFDQMNSAFERAQSLQEEYLTTTNQIYETTKMMRTAQQAIDKSTNSIAKQKLANFVKETKSLQDQNKLSKFELDMQQAKYDLLVAEIALEEAQNAKSVVRLQRDAEGNFGYVYTADSSEVNNALQAFDDAQNALYNKGLEATNEYTEKYKSTLSSMYDQLSEAHENYLNGVYESEEEYQAEVEAIKEFHFAKLGDYSRLYSLAIETDSAVAQDAWSIEFSTMINSTEQWKKKVNDYLVEANTTLGTWSDKVVEIQNTTKQPFDNLESEVEDIVTESQNLIDKLLGKDGEKGLVGALQDEIDKVGAASTAYATYRGEVVKTIEELANLKDTIKSKMSGKLTISWEPEQPAPEEPGDNDNSQGDDFEGPPLPPSTSSSSSGSIDVSTTSATSLEDKIRDAIERGTTLNLDLSEITVDNDIMTLPNGTQYQRVYMDEEQVAIYVPDEKNVYWSFSKFPGGPTLQGTANISFDTGGYTGAWGPEGKMAMLHEKELVLNKDDTSNLLMTIDLLDNILSKIDFYAMSQQFGGILSSPNNIAAAASALEQNVKIEASFPNVQDKYEIEEAFNTLINKASQYANRK